MECEEYAGIGRSDVRLLKLPGHLGTLNLRAHGRQPRRQDPAQAGTRLPLAAHRLGGGTADLPILQGQAAFSAVTHGRGPFACVRSKIVKSNYVFGLPANGQLTGTSYSVHETAGARVSPREGEGRKWLR